MSETVTQVNETTQQIVRSRTCGLKDFYIALVQSNTATAYTAGTPVKLARAIKAKIDEKWTSEKIYSDDNTEEVSPHTREQMSNWRSMLLHRRTE